MKIIFIHEKLTLVIPINKIEIRDRVMVYDESITRPSIFKVQSRGILIRIGCRAAENLFKCIQKGELESRMTLDMATLKYMHNTCCTGAGYR